MEKKILIILLLILASIPIIVSIPQFLLFQGHVTLDGRIASEAVINFSIEGTQIANPSTDVNGEYGPILVQGFEELYSKPIDITIDGYSVEQEINYTYPQDIYLNLSALTDKALKITESFPSETEVRVSQAGIQSFGLSTETGHDDVVIYSVFLDGALVSNTSSYDYDIGNNDEGTHEIEISATDGFLIVSEEWELIIERPETSNFDGDTTDFDSLGLDELGSVSDVVLEKVGKGKIEFLEDLNLIGVTDLNDKVRIERGIVAIDTSAYPQLNKPARITFTGLRYSTIPKIFYSNEFTINPFSINQECDFCNILNYTPHPTTNGVVIFEVEHFSSFMAGESGNRYNLSLFDDLDTCKAGTIGDLDLKVKNPDEGDEFGPGEEMEIKIDIENNANEDMRIIIEASLYNINEDDVEEETDDEKKIRNGKDETFELILEIPDDFEDDNYLLFVKAYEDRNEEEQCVEGAIGIDLKREKHDVIIKEFSLTSESVVAGKSFDVFAEVQNIGESDEDVYLAAEIKELGVLTESETFELEEFGKDDTNLEIISIKIPENAEKGEYDIEIKAFFDGEEDGRTVVISVLERVPIELKPIDLTIGPLDLTTKEIKEIQKIEKIPRIEKTQKTREAFEIPLIVPVLLSVGIIILIIFIVIVSLKRK